MRSLTGVKSKCSISMGENLEWWDVWGVTWLLYLLYLGILCKMLSCKEMDSSRIISGDMLFRIFYINKQANERNLKDGLNENVPAFYLEYNPNN